MEPLVSVIMASYNYARFIPDAIESVLNQDYENWELIVVDDGSTDESRDIVSGYTEKYPGKISLHTHPGNENRNIKATYELGLSKANGKYIAYLESDDLWYKENLRKKVAALEKFPEVVLVYSGVLYTGDNVSYGDRTYKSLLASIGRKNNEYPGYITRSLFIGNPLASFSNMVCRADVLRRVRLIHEYQIWSDYVTVIQMSALGRFYFVDDDLVTIRKHKSNSSLLYSNQSDNYLLGTALKIDMMQWYKNYLAAVGNNDRIMDLYHYYFSWKSPLFRLSYTFSKGIRSVFFKFLYRFTHS